MSARPLPLPTRACRCQRLAQTLSFALLFAGAVACAPLCGVEPTTERTALDALTGEWVGEIRIQAPDGYLVRTLPVERTYTWEGDVQVVETRFEADGQPYLSRARQEVLLGRLRSVIHRPTQVSEEYQGSILGDALVWTDVDRTNRWFKETLSVVDGAQVLEIYGVEAMRLDSVSGLVRVTLDLHRKPGSALPVATPGADPALVARVTELEENLAAARANAEQARAAHTKVEQERDAFRLQAQAAEARATTLGAESEAATAAATKTREELTAAQARAASAEAQANEVRSAAENATRERDALQARLDQALAEAKRVAQQVDAAATAQVDLQQKLARNQGSLERAEAELASTRSELETVRAYVAAAGDESKDAADKLASVEAARAEIERQLTATAQERDAALADLREAGSGRAALQAELATTSAALAVAKAAAARADSANDTLATLRAELGETQARLAAASDQLVRTVSERDTARDETAGVRTTLDKNKAELAEVRHQAIDLGSELAAVRRAFDEASAAHTEELARMRADLEQSKTSASAAATSVAESTEARGRLENQLAELRQQLIDAGRRQTELVAQIETTKQHAAEASSDSGKLRDRLTAAEAENARLTTDLDAARTQAENAQAAMAGLRADCDAALARASDATDEMAKARSEHETALSAMQTRVAQLEKDARELADVRRQAIDLGAELAALREAQSASSDANATELRQLRADLETARSDAAAAAASADRASGEKAALEDKVARLQTELELAMRATGEARSAARADIAAADAARDSVIERLATAQSELDAVRRAADGAEGARREADTLRARLAETQAELAAAETSARDASTASAAELERMRAEVGGQSAVALQRQQDNERLVARLEALNTERDALLARVKSFEETSAHVATEDTAMPLGQDADAGITFRMPAAAAEGDPREQLMVEITRLDRRVIELESERNSLRASQAVLQGQLAQAVRLRDETVARFEALVTQLTALREDRDRLAQNNATLETEVRTARAAGNAPRATPPADGEDTLLARFLASVQGDSTSANAQPARTVDTVINSFTIVGTTRSGEEDKVILDGRVYRGGDVVDAALGIVFKRIEGNTLVFGDARGREYRRRF